MAKETTDREKELMENFIIAVKDVFNLEIDEKTYKEATAEKFVSLKKALSNINNIVTLKITNLFIEKLREDEFISKDQKIEMIENSNKQKANANGYDVEYPDPKKKSNVEKPKILAEVKCNIPVGKTTFGSKQKDGILKDIEGLLIAEKKTTSQLSATEGYFKFMVFMDYTEDGCDVRKSVDELLKHMPYKGIDIITRDKVKFYKKDEPLDKNHVYIIYI